MNDDDLMLELAGSDKWTKDERWQWEVNRLRDELDKANSRGYARELQNSRVEPSFKTIEAAVTDALAKERDRLYKEVHDEKSRQLDAALIDNKMLEEAHAARFRETAKAIAEVTKLKAVNKLLVTEIESIKPAYLENKREALQTFANELTNLCKVHNVKLLAGSCEHEGYLMIDGTFNDAEKYVVKKEANVLYLDTHFTGTFERDD